MALPLLHRTDRVHGIEARIDDLGEQATKLLGREEAALAKLEDLRSASREPKGRLRGARLGKAGSAVGVFMLTASPGAS